MSTSIPVEQFRDRYALSPAEAARALGICRATIYNLIARGELKASKIGRSTRIALSEIERLLADGTEAA
jgi:excisionase family DNA binding protein